MSDKKHIDRLFQEGFKDFEVTPNNAVWRNIESELKKKNKKRRVIPIWWRYAGIAALLLLLVTIGGLYFNTIDEASINNVVDVDSENPNSESINIISKNPLNNGSAKSNILISDNNKESLNDTSNIKSEIIKHKKIPSKKISITESSSSKNQNESKTKLVSSDKLYIKHKRNNGNNTIITNAPEEKNKEEENKIETIHQALKNKTHIANALKKDSIIESKSETPIANSEKPKSLLINTPKNNTAIADVKLNQVENIKTDEKSKDKKRSIEDALNETKVVLETNNKLNSKWSVAPNLAPVYFNKLGNGSSIHPQFNTNSTSGDINMSYGISTSYAINKKIRVRSGINSVNLGYNTNDVVVFQSVGVNRLSSGLKNIDGTSNNISLISSEALNSVAPTSITSSNAEINQNLRYIEIPLEIKYTLSDKKFGFNLIGGFSSFILNTSEIFYEQEDGSRRYLGEANNINKISYSANLGLGLNYKVTKKFDLNLEPIFKYQFNTFNNTSGNLSPYFIGVYTGFSINF